VVVVGASVVVVVKAVFVVVVIGTVVVVVGAVVVVVHVHPHGFVVVVVECEHGAVVVVVEPVQGCCRSTVVVRVSTEPLVHEPVTVSVTVPVKLPGTTVVALVEPSGGTVAL
jgi:hypothetical protein